MIISTFVLSVFIFESNEYTTFVIFLSLTHFANKPFKSAIEIYRLINLLNIFIIKKSIIILGDLQNFLK